MNALSETLSDHHVHCDDCFAVAEAAAHGGRWADCAAATERFCAGMDAHFAAEEEVLFPAFEARTGMTQGPTAVMRHEHAQVRELMEELKAGARNADLDQFHGAAETLLILMQQHNMKEENILYPMCDQAIGRDGDIAAGISRRLNGD